MRGNIESPATWLSETLSTITSKVFTKLTISLIIASSDVTNENRAREWRSVDNMLDQFSMCDDVTLVASPPRWAVKDKFRELAEGSFPSMWKNERVVVEMPPP